METTEYRICLSDNFRSTSFAVEAVNEREAIREAKNLHRALKGTRGIIKVTAAYVVGAD